MFPNVRLMIVAMVASVVALSCGFGLFAAFRVNHEPLVRLPAATAQLQLVADNPVTLSPLVAAAELLRQPQSARPQNADSTTDSPAGERNDREDVAAAPAASAAAPGPAAGEVEKTAALAPPTESAAMPSASPLPEPTANTDTPAVDDQPTVASTPQSEPATAPAGDAVATPAAADAATTEAGQDGQTPVAAEPTGEPAPAAALTLAAVEPPAKPPLPRDRPNTVPKAGSASIREKAAAPAHRTSDKAATKKTKRTHVVARVHRARPTVSAAADAFDQNSAFSQSNFQTAPPEPQPQLVYRWTVRTHRAKVAARKTKATNSAAGGPFVSPPTR